MSPAGIPDDAVELEFQVIREDWGEYELDRGRVTLRGRAILMRLYQVGENQLIANHQKLFAVKAHDDALRGEPTPIDLAKANETKVDVDCEATTEPWSEYRILTDPPQVLRMRLVVSGAERVPGMYDELGQPFYLIANQIVMGKPRPDTNPARP